ncbi:interferon regulatory factor 3-like [Dryobates pubescens]|uniref:interferon regulatory factor 3-like n=1 Tax=Dryobates pubescens TaxID=118200 RepID=UPI0023BA1DD8|nr:interferon regulatory factor 3-like [Dryobates pubescens]
MAAPSSEGEAQKLRFGPWLLAAVESGKYPGLCWTDRSRCCFRVPWKHNARKDVTSSDVEVFKAWAVVSGHYEGCSEDPAKWKTNFRCALRSTRLFQLLEDRSKCGDDPHKVFTISSGDISHQDILLQPHPDPSQNNHLPQWVPLLDQPLLGTYQPQDPLLLSLPARSVLLLRQQRVLGLGRGREPLCPPPLAAGPLLILDITILYRGRQVLQEEVLGRQCLLASQLLDPALALLPGQAVLFPSPAELPDPKQRRYTEQLLRDAGLRLEQRAQRILATRLKRCQVFWALGRQLEGPQEPPNNLLQRHQETPIFDFSRFCAELSAFRSSQLRRSPDFTIYFCFGQQFSQARSKESKLILVKLVPRLCQYLYEKVQQEGASSLDSDTISLKLSDSFSLYELIEHWPMQVD